jgi:invasion protein IalB
MAGVLARLLVGLICVGVGQPTVAAVKNGQRFQDWAVHCEKPAKAKTEKCFLFQTLVNKENKKPILQVVIGYLLEGDKPIAIFTTPLGVALRAGVGVQVDSGKTNRVPYENCNPGGCIAGLPLNAAVLGELKKGSKMHVEIHDGTGKAGTLDISLKGLNAGFGALR